MKPEEKVGLKPWQCWLMNTKANAGLEPWQCWQCALANYRYPVNLREFCDSDDYDGWFSKNIDTGDREQTIAFEDSFRKAAEDHLEAWFEVVFWKLYSGHRGKAVDIIRRIKQRGVRAKDLWHMCLEFIDAFSESRMFSESKFRSFQKLVVGGRNIAVCATFPAFISPDRFPMVDAQVTRWVSAHYLEQNGSGDTNVMLEPPQPTPSDGPLTISQYPFVRQWVLWCRAKAQELSELSSFCWRARDVEMAVFTAQRNTLHLPPIARA